MFLRPILPVFGIVLVLLVGLGLVALGLRRRTRSARLDAARRALLVVVLALMCAGPSIPGEATEVRTAAQAWIVVDRTGSMAAEDYEGGAPRIDGVKKDIAAILDEMPGARATILVWDSDLRTVLPLTTDRGAVDSFLETFAQELSASSAGSSPNRPAAGLAEALAASKEADPQEVRALFVLTDGETSNEGAWSPYEIDDPSAWNRVGTLVDGGAIIGYGTAEGGRMRVRRLNDVQSGAPEEYIPDGYGPDAPDAISRIDEDALRGIASRTGLEYVHSPADSRIRSVAASIDDSAERVVEAREAVAAARYVLWPFALVLGALLAWESAVLAGRARALRRSRAI